MMRTVGGWQMGIAALLLADPANVHALSSYVAAGALLLSVPAWESLSAPKQPIAGWIALLASLGKGGFDGNIPSWVPTALYLVNGAQFHFAPEFSAKLYEAKGVSKLGHSMLGLAGSMMLVGGTYIYALQRGDAQSAALGYAFAVNGALAGHHVRNSVPRLPQKKLRLLQDHNDQSFLDARRRDLDGYVAKLVHVPHVWATPPAAPFVGVANNVREYSVVFPERTLGFTLGKSSGAESR